MEMHPNHVRFVTTYELYEVTDLFAALEALEPERRDVAMGHTYLHVIGLNPDLDHGRASQAEWGEFYNYERFKAKVREVTEGQGMIDYFLVRAVLFDVLLSLFHVDDPDRPVPPPDRLEALRDEAYERQARLTHPVLRQINRVAVDLFDDLVEMRKEPRPERPPMYWEFCEVALGALFRRVDGR